MSKFYSPLAMLALFSACEFDRCIKMVNFVPFTCFSFRHLLQYGAYYIDIMRLSYSCAVRGTCWQHVLAGRGRHGAVDLERKKERKRQGERYAAFQGSEFRLGDISTKLVSCSEPLTHDTKFVLLGCNNRPF